jgi:hypothetical protein
MATVMAPGAAAAGLALGVAFVALGVHSTPLTPREVATTCAEAEDPAHCGRLVEAVQLKRLPSLAVREGTVLKVSLFPSGTATFTDTEALNGGRTFSLWDAYSDINAVLLYTTDGDTIGFVLLQRASGRTVELPSEPRVSPDRQRLVTADFCATRCVNELAVWRVLRDDVRKELVWSPAAAWDEATATWKGPDTVVVEYTTTGGATQATTERRLSDAGWRRADAP